MSDTDGDITWSDEPHGTSLQLLHELQHAYTSGAFPVHRVHLLEYAKSAHASEQLIAHLETILSREYSSFDDVIGTKNDST